MKTLFIFIALLFAVQAYGQGARYDGVLLDQNGKPVVGVNVRVCSSPATGQPCTPLANIYSNLALTFPLQNPITTDFLGNFYFYATCATYELEFSGQGVLTKQVPDVTVTSPTCGGGGGGGKLIQVNAVPIPGNTGNFNNSAPAPQAGFTNLNWQQDFNSPVTGISVEVPNASTSVAGIIEISKDLCGSFTAPLVCGIQGNPVTISGLSIGQVICANTTSSFTNCNGVGSGTVTDFIAGSLAPLFTTNVSNPTTTPDLTFTLSNAGPHLYYGNNTGSTGPPAFVAITDNDLPPANVRRVCMIVVGTDDGAALVNSNLGPQGDQCYVPYGATVVEIMVTANTGTPNTIPGRNHLGTIANLVSSALATASGGARACSNTGGTLSLDGSTTCAATLQNTSISQGDFLDLVSGTAGGTAARMSIAITFTPN